MATAEDFLKIARAEIGNGPSKYNAGGNPWCAIFINWCLKQVDYGKYGTASAASFGSFGKRHTKMDMYRPKAGDLLLVNYNHKANWAQHVAIVEAYDGIKLTTINGNGTGNKVTRSTRLYSGEITIVEMRWESSVKLETIIPEEYLYKVINEEDSTSGYFFEDDSYVGTENSGTESVGVAEDKITYFTDTNERIPIHPMLFSLPEIAIDSDYALYINNRNVTASVGTLSWENTRSELACKMEFSAAKSDARFTHLYQPQKGDIVRLFMPNEMFRGMILSADIGDRHSSKFVAVDVGWHMGKCKDTYQFNDMESEDAVKKICADLGIPIIFLDTEGLSGKRYTGVHIDKTASEVLWAILNSAGGQWNFDFVPGGIRIYRIGTYEAKPQFRVSKNTMLHDAVEHRGPEKRTSSIEDMKNAVKVVSDTNVLVKGRNGANYQQYGFLQEVVKIDPEKENAENVLEEKLAELNTEKNTLGFPMVVQLSDYTRAGEILDVKGIRYVIESAKHTLKKGRHQVSVELERVEMA